MDKNIQLFCNADATGRITKILTGDRIVGTNTYQYFFMIDKKQQANLDKYYIENGELKQIEDTTLIEVENPNPSTEEQLAEVKKQLIAMQEQYAVTQAILEKLVGSGSAPTEPEEETPTVPEEPPVEEPTDPVEEPPTEEPPTEGETEPTPEEPTEPPTGDEETPTEEPPVEEPAADEPVDETPVEEPTNPTE